MRFQIPLALALLAAAAPAVAQTAAPVPPLTREAATDAISKKEKIARNDPLTCPIFVSKIVTQGSWAFVDAGCNAPGEGALVLAIFHYNNGHWNFACSHSNIEPFTAQKAADNCGMTHDQAVQFGFPDKP